MSSSVGSPRVRDGEATNFRGPFDEATSLRMEAEFLSARTLTDEVTSSKAGSPPPKAHIGLALSGGGVRAAAFHCGVYWALASEGLMKHVLHLSAVSGGGYTAASLATHIVRMSDEVSSAPSLDAWYKDVVSRTILRMQHNIGFIARCDKSFLGCISCGSHGVVGGAVCPIVCDWPLILVTIIVSVCLTPALIAINVIWPIVLSFEHAVGGTLRGAWCDPISPSVDSSDLAHWVRTRCMLGACGALALAVLLKVCDLVGCSKPRSPSYNGYLMRRSAMQVLLRGVLFIMGYIALPYFLLLLQRYTYGINVDGSNSQFVRHMCWKYINVTWGSGAPSCSDNELFPNSGLWYQSGNNALYLNWTWAATHASASSTSVQPQTAVSYLSPVLFFTCALIATAGFLGLELLFGLSLLRWFLTVAGPLLAATIVAQVAQWRVFGPVTAQVLVQGQYPYSHDNLRWMFMMFAIVALLTVPIYDRANKIAHYYYRRALQVAFFSDGRDVDIADVAHCPQCPNLLLGGSVSDYRAPEEVELLSDFTLTPLFLGSHRTGFFPTDQNLRLGYLTTISGAAPDAFLLMTCDVLPIRYLLSALSLRFGDFVRLEPDGKAAVQLGRAVAAARRFGGSATRRLGESTSSSSDHSRFGYITQRCFQHTTDRFLVAAPFIVCQLVLVVSQTCDGINCISYGILVQFASIGLSLLLCLSFFAFSPFLRWLMRSPMILQFQMLCMHRHRAPRPPPYVYLSDGGLIEVSGILALLRRRVPVIICSDACEDPDVSLRALYDVMAAARKERLCSFYDVEDPRRNVELSMAELRQGPQTYLRVGIRYEAVAGTASTLGSAPLMGELLHIRMRLADGDCAAVRELLTKEELLSPPRAPPGTGFDLEGNVAHAPRSSISQTRDALAADNVASQTQPLHPPENMRMLIADARQINSQQPKLRAEMDGSCCAACCGTCGGRRFPNFSVGNQCLQPLHFANLCALGAEMSLPAVQHVARSHC